MSASVLARSYNDDTPTGQPPLLHLPSATGGSRSSRPPSVPRPTPSSAAAAAAATAMSNMKGERERNGVPSANGMRISFATDTSFHERNVRSRKASRSSATSLNLRIVQGSERPSKVRIRIPKATTATGMRKPSASHDEYLNPRKAVEIARSYGIPKYFLRSNSQQILTDGRMRLFGDSIWKKERTSIDLDRQSIDSSDVINRLMDSVNKAIETAHKRRNMTQSIGDDAAGMHLEVVSLKSSADDVEHHQKQDAASDKVGRMTREHSSSLENIHSIGAGGGRPMTEAGGSRRILPVNSIRSSLDSKLSASLETNENGFRPHTVDAMGSVSFSGYLPKVTFKDTDMLIKCTDDSANTNSSSSVLPSTPSAGGIRLKQLAAPFKAVSDFTLISEKAKMLDDKYHNVLPRFYPAVSAHQCKQSKVELEKSASQSNRKKTNQHRLVRFADAHTVRFANDAATDKKDEDSLSGVVVRRAPVQSVQRALDSHSCLVPIEKNKNRLKDNLSNKHDVIDEGISDGVHYHTMNTTE